jgi:predicted AAA+ superfamily ATPase
LLFGKILVDKKVGLGKLVLLRYRMEKEYKRWQTERTQRALKNWRVVTISGARQTGKTTMTKQVIGDKGVYRSLDNDTFMNLAQSDPAEFIKNSKGTMVIDEVQTVPKLMKEIKMAVDQDNRRGQYLLTGSANIQTISTVNDSLAGRIKHIRLRPLTVGEILERKPTFLERTFSGEFPSQIRGYDKDTIFDLAMRGGYPEVLTYTSRNEYREWHWEYVNNLIKKDLNDIESVRRLDVIQDLVMILAAWSGQYIDKAKIGSRLEIAKQTLDVYLNALNALFLYERVPAWLRTDYELIKKKTKIFMTDSGLMASLLNWKREEILLDPDKAGKLLETFIFHELSSQIDLDFDYSLYQYRDKQKREIDFLIEKTGSGLIGIEVKSSRSVYKTDFNSQIWFKENILKNKVPFKGYVLYTGEDTLSFGNGLKAVPIATLWDV